MQTFRFHGLAAPEPAPRVIPVFGRYAPRRYGRAPGRRITPATTPALVVADDDAFACVDQEFEELFFE